MSAKPASQVARNAGLNLVGQTLPLVVALATLPFTIRGLGTARFGVLALAWAALGYFGTFDLGLGRAATKFVAEAIGKGEPQRIASVVWTTVVVQLGFGVLVSTLALVATPFLFERVLSVPAGLTREAETAFRLLCIAIPSVLASGSLGGALEAAQRFDLVNAVRTPFSAANHLLPLLGVLLGWGLVGIVGLLLGSRVLAVAVQYYCCRLVFPSLRGWPQFSRVELRSLMRFGAWVTVSSIVIPLFIYLDRFLIGSLRNLSDVAYYTAPYEAVSKLLFIPAGVASVLFPAFSSLFAIGDRIGVSMSVARWTKYVVVIMTPITMVFLVFADQILSVWLGHDFAVQSAVVFRLISVAVLLNSIGYIPVALVEGVGRPDVVAKYHLVELPVYAGVAYALIATLGINGAALAWCLRMVWTIPIFFVLCAKIAGVPLNALSQAGTVRGFLVGSALLLTTVGFWHKWTVPVTVSIATALLIAYALIVWYHVLDGFDRLQLERTYSTFRRKKRLL